MSAESANARNAAKHLRLIAADIRGWGDIPLVRLSEDGVTRDPLTLADELELIAISLAGTLMVDRDDDSGGA